MMQGTRSVYAGFTWYIICVSLLYFLVNQYFNGMSPKFPLELVAHAKFDFRIGGIGWVADIIAIQNLNRRRAASTADV